MSALEVLKTAAAFTGGKVAGGLPPDIVRFTLEYRQEPDLAQERQRIATLLGADGFKLEPLDPDLPRFLVLQFPGIARTISTPTLYAMADELARELNLVSCVPDVGATFVVEPDPADPISESVFGDAVLKLTCWVEDDDTLPKTWAITSIRADKAWAKTQGQGIIIAQPDTGIAKHQELDAEAFDLTKAKNLLDGSSNPTDPLSADAGNPGHGTATSSVVISRTAREIVGSAPGATLVPIRCIESVVLKIDGSPVARAVLHAKRIGADVITMSLGGLFYSPSLGAALDEAVKAGIIVCAAAGNCVQKIVVYPANDPNVIALAGIDHNDKPWKGTSRGAKIDAAAPAENVFVARRKPDDGGVGTITPSQGTSYATAITAGVAALWLAHHGRDKVRQEAAKRHMSVHQLFRSALRATARVPQGGGWDHKNFGAGIVDAEALLAMALAAIPQPPALPEAVATDDPEDAVTSVMIGAAERAGGGSFDWRRHGAEAVYLATDAWRRASPTRSMLVESARKPHPSPDLAATAPAVLRTALAQAADAPAMRTPAVNEPSSREAIRILGARGHGGAESSAQITVEKARENLRGSGLRDLQDLAKKVFDALDAEGGGLEGAGQRRSVLEASERVVRSVLAGQEYTLTPEDRVTLEALVKLKDRPALRVVNGGVDPTDPLFGEWGGSLFAVPELPELTGAVGRIDAGGEHIGTGFLIAADIIMTNRHVLEALAEEVRGPARSTWVFIGGEPTVDFSETADGTARFRITEVIAAGADPTQGLVDFAHLDMALLKVETTNAQGHKLPKPIAPIKDRPELIQKGEFFAIGFPARPSTSSMMDPKTGTFSAEVAKRLAQIFNLKFGRKYLSPGAVAQPRGTVADDPHSWVFAHDATTLGGNSGSCAIRIMDPLGVAGLHFGGATLTANYAHDLAAVKATGRMPALDAPEIVWR
jgi:hypothetical protein